MTVTRPPTRYGARRWFSLLAAAGVIAGGVMIIVGSFLPWSVSRDEPLFSVAWQGGDWDGLLEGTALRVIIPCLIVLFAGLVMVVAGAATSRRPSWWKWTLLAAVAAGIMGWGAFGAAGERFGGFSHPAGFSFGEHLDVPGVGLWLILGGAVIGSIASLARRPPRPASPPDA
jgi:hypothetical protein